MDNVICYKLKILINLLLHYGSYMTQGFFFFSGLYIKVNFNRILLQIISNRHRHHNAIHSRHLLLFRHTKVIFVIQAGS